MHSDTLTAPSPAESAIPVPFDLSEKPFSGHALDLYDLVAQRIVMLDGAMGTMIQRHKLEEDDFRGDRFPDPPKPLKGNNDLLVLTQPEIIEDIHLGYLNAGSDIIETNTFSGTSVAQADYGLQEIVYELNVEAAKLARRAVERYEKEHPGEKKWVAGAVGPTNKQLSMGTDVTDPGARSTTFEEMKNAYREQIRGLVDGGVDILMPETIFDTLVAKAAIFAIEEHFDEIGRRLPLIVSGTITDKSGRTLSGQTVEAFWYSVQHATPLAVGLNCALGAEMMFPHLEELSRFAPCYTSCYPNAGLPDPLSPTGFPEGPEDTARNLQPFAEAGLLNLVGGCCGTTPEHIAAIKDMVSKFEPRQPPKPDHAMKLSGMSPFVIGRGS